MKELLEIPEIEDEVEDTEDFGDDVLDRENDAFDDDFDFNDFGADMQVPMEKHSDLLKDLTNFSGYHKDLVNGWLGLTWNEKQQTFAKDPFASPIMNKKGATWCVTFLKTYTRKNNIITHIGREEYVNMLLEVIDTIWLNIPLKRKEFEIKSLGDCLRICNEVEHAVQLILMGAGDGRYNKLLTEATQRTENISSNNRMMPGMQYPGMIPMPQTQMSAKGYMQKGIDYLKGK